MKKLLGIPLVILGSPGIPGLLVILAIGLSASSDWGWLDIAIGGILLLPSLPFLPPLICGIRLCSQ